MQAPILCLGLVLDRYDEIEAAAYAAMRETKIDAEVWAEEGQVFVEADSPVLADHLSFYVALSKAFFEAKRGEDR